MAKNKIVILKTWQNGIFLPWHTIKNFKNVEKHKLLAFEFVFLKKKHMAVHCESQKCTTLFGHS